MDQGQKGDACASLSSYDDDKGNKAVNLLLGEEWTHTQSSGVQTQWCPVMINAGGGQEPDIMLQTPVRGLTEGLMMVLSCGEQWFGAPDKPIKHVVTKEGKR